MVVCFTWIPVSVIDYFLNSGTEFNGVILLLNVLFTPIAEVSVSLKSYFELFIMTSVICETIRHR